MLEITGDHVAKLKDDDLRTLVTRLCEAELRIRSLPLASITSGGHQDAADGGIDVRVDINETVIPSLDFIPKPITGFQVKCSDMPANKIHAEMRPDGDLRPSILNLIAASGAYVIVSSQGSVADSALSERREAMRTAIGDLENRNSVHLDFYDRERIANWVRSYPGVGLWLRQGS